MIASLLLLAAAAAPPASNQTPERSAGPQPGRDYATLNVCKLVPGDAIARAFGGKLAEVRPFSDKSFSRCVYFIVPPGRDKPLGYVLYIQPPKDFEELKKHIAEPLTTLTGLGDDAYMFRNKGDGRFKIHVLKRGDLMFQANADTAESARKVADAVVTQLWRKAP